MTDHNNLDPSREKRDRAKKWQLKVRRDAVLGHLEEKQGQEVPFELLLDDLQSRAASPIPKLQKDQDRMLRQIAKEIQIILPALRSDLELCVRDRHMRLNATGDSVYGSREKDNPQVKEMLARAAAYCLFGYGQIPSEDQVAMHPTESINSKLMRLKQQFEVSLILDAGTTTATLGKYLFESPCYPLITSTGLLQPSILSNSAYLAIIAEHSRHGDAFPFDLIGGTLRSKHGSYCGTRSMAALKAWDDKMFDVSIIGATGYRSVASGVSGFCCADPSERVMKAALLKKAVGLSCVICDSSKLLRHDASHIFVPVFNSSLDLVIIDDGSQTKVPPEVVSVFVETANHNGVAVLLVKQFAEV